MKLHSDAYTVHTFPKGFIDSLDLFIDLLSNLIKGISECYNFSLFGTLFE